MRVDPSRRQADIPRRQRSVLAFHAGVRTHVFERLYRADTGFADVIDTVVCSMKLAQPTEPS